MKWLLRVGLVLTFLLALALPGTALASGLISDRVVFGTNFTLTSEETLDGNLVMLGGNATLEAGSHVTGDVVLMGGNLQSNGTVDGTVIALGGSVRLDAEAVVEGDVALLGGRLDQAEGARVLGDVTRADNGPLSLNFPGGVEMPNMQVSFDPFFNLLGFTFKIFLWAALAVLLALLAPNYTRRVSDAVTSAPVVSGGLGLLTVVVLPPALVVLTLTLLLAPAALIAAAVAALAWIFGLAALGSEVGRRLEKGLNQEWAPAVSAGVGTLVMMLVLNGARAAVPCVGWIFPAAAGMLGLGAVLLTRFGTQPYPPFGMPAGSGLMPVPPDASAAPEAPAWADEPPADVQ